MYSAVSWTSFEESKADGIVLKFPRQRKKKNRRLTGLKRRGYTMLLFQLNIVRVSFDTSYVFLLAAHFNVKYTTL